MEHIALVLTCAMAKIITAITVAIISPIMAKHRKMSNVIVLEWLYVSWLIAFIFKNRV